MTNLAAMVRQVRKIKSTIKKPSAIATTPTGKVEISPKELLDYFIAAIRLGGIPKDHKLYPIFRDAEEDKDQGQIFGCLRKLAQGLEPSIENGDLFLPVGKQAQSILESTDRLNLWYGSIRSSKTIMSLIKWLDRCCNGPSGRRMMVGNTSETLELNCIEPLKDLLPSAIQHVTGWRHCIIFGRKVVLRGANDVGQEKKFRGPTLIDAYGDEVTTWAKSVFKMLLTRLSRPGSWFGGTTNPDQPLHWLNVEYIERVNELRLKLWHFVLDDNPGLPDDYKADLIRENPPGTVYYLRFILGLWVAAEGRIYNMFSEASHVVHDAIPRFADIIIGVDYGTTNPAAFVALGKVADGPHKGKWMAFKEFFQAGKTDKELSGEFKTFLDRWHPSSVEVDPSAASFKLQLRRDGQSCVHDADHSVLDGIRNVASMLVDGSLIIHDSCKHLIEELTNYRWDAKVQEQGKDAPLKINDHCCDALRYAMRRAVRRRFV